MKRHPAWPMGILLALATLALPCAPLAGEPGSAGLLSMRLGVGGRSGAMGETGVASAIDGSAIFWNPANLGYVEGTQLVLQHMEYFDSFRKESLTVAHDTPVGSFGLLFSGFYSDELVRRSDEQAGAAQGSFQPYDLVVGLGYARDIPQMEIAVGVAAKLVYERIDVHSGTGLAFDVGITHRGKIEGLTLAATLQNYGGRFTLDQEEFDLPLLGRLGFSYRPQLDSAPWARRLVMASDLVVPNDGNGRLHAGLEVQIHESFDLRAGQRFAYDTWGPTFGFGYRRDSLRVDYAYMSNDNDFEATHRFSLGFAYLP